MLLYSEQKQELVDFGLDCLSLDEAAELVVKCLFCNGEIDIPYSKEVVSLFDPELDELLKNQISEFLKTLILAVHEGSLKAEKIQRDLEGAYVTEETFIKDQVLYDWLLT